MAKTGTGHGGFVFVDFSQFGEFTSGTASTGNDTAALFEQITQRKKAVIISGLKVGVTASGTTTHYEYPPMMIAFKPTSSTAATGIGSYGGKNLTIAITNAGSITCTQA